MDEKIIPVAGIRGDDDNATLVVGKVVPDAVPRRMVPRLQGTNLTTAEGGSTVPHRMVPRPQGSQFSDDVNHPSPHAPRDKTEEWDMRRQGHPLPAVELAADADSYGKRKNAVSRDSRTLAERAGLDWPREPVQIRHHDGFPEDEVEQEGDDFEYKTKDGRNLDELAEQIIRTGRAQVMVDAARSPVEQVETLGQGATGGGKRMNAGKTRIELLPEIWLWALADVMTQGSKKYDPRNWEKGMDWSAMIGCMHRHLAKFQAGQRYDGPEFDKELGTTGCHELAMVAWNALALMFYDLYGIGTNDLPAQPLNMFVRVNAETSDLAERIGESLK